MNADTLVYGLTEDQQTKLYQAKHLADLLAGLSTELCCHQTEVHLNAESLAIAFGFLRDSLDIDCHSLK
jgi:hypothetical protein